MIRNKLNVSVRLLAAVYLLLGLTTAHASDDPSDIFSDNYDPFVNDHYYPDEIVRICPRNYALAEFTSSTQGFCIDTPPAIMCGSQSDLTTSISPTESITSFAITSDSDCAKRELLYQYLVEHPNDPVLYEISATAYEMIMTFRSTFIFDPPVSAATSGQPAISALTGPESSPFGRIEHEILTLDIFGGDLPPDVMFRESPTLASIGLTEAKLVGTDSSGDPIYRVDSFFDVFLEVSLDGGQSWTPLDEPLHLVGAVPEPHSLLLGVLACLALSGRRRSLPT